MARWRFLRGWTAEELDENLSKAATLEPNFSDDGGLSRELGWNVVTSRASIAREAPGVPVEGGAFSLAWEAIARFEHSDPRIVAVHFRRGAELPERLLLLELRALGLRFLCPARIAAVQTGGDADFTHRSFTLETLRGHIERGKERFLLEKDHRTGEIRFLIEAAWLPGDLPNWWSRLGFELVGRRYQRAWHRLAHLRLRRIAAGAGAERSRAGGDIEQEGAPMAIQPVQFVAQRGLGRWGVDVEQEMEDMRRDTLWRAAGFGALSGIRSLGPPAILWRPKRGLGPALVLLAAGEMIADKLPIPPRTRPISLAARALSGGLAGGQATGTRRRWRGSGALVGATAAIASTFLSREVRAWADRRSRALGYAVAIAEDAVVVFAGARLAASMARRRRGC